MDGCLLSHAFPEMPGAGCTDSSASMTQKKQEKKKAKRCRGPQAWYTSSEFPLGPYANNSDIDPDRPAVKRMDSVPSLNSKTGLREHAPVDQDWGTNEPFVGGSGCLPEIRKTVESATKLKSSEKPAFFGANPSDDMTVKRGLAEGFSDTMNPAEFVNVIGEDDSYRLMPDFGEIANLNGTGKAQGKPMFVGPSDLENETAFLTQTTLEPGSVVPNPNVDIFWKGSSNPVSGGQSSYFSQLKAPGGLPSGSYTTKTEDQKSEVNTISQKLDKIFARLDDMEQSSADSAQTEVLLFIMTGLGIIFLMDVACRTAAK